MPLLLRVFSEREEQDLSKGQCQLVGLGSFATPTKNFFTTLYPITRVIIKNIKTKRYFKADGMYIILSYYKKRVSFIAYRKIVIAYSKYKN